MVKGRLKSIRRIGEYHDQFWRNKWKSFTSYSNPNLDLAHERVQLQDLILHPLLIAILKWTFIFLTISYYYLWISRLPKKLRLVFPSVRGGQIFQELFRIHFDIMAIMALFFEILSITLDPPLLYSTTY